MKLKTILLVAFGGALGALLRYLLVYILPQNEFAFATLAANLTGSFLLAMLTAMWLERLLNEAWKPLLGTGFCGGFTTMSTFAGELYHYAAMGAILKGVLYLFLSLFGGMAFGLLGYISGKRLADFKRREREL